jgi:hypothetical protein
LNGGITAALVDCAAALPIPSRQQQQTTSSARLAAADVVRSISGCLSLVLMHAEQQAYPQARLLLECVTRCLWGSEAQALNAALLLGSLLQELTDGNNKLWQPVLQVSPAVDKPSVRSIWTLISNVMCSVHVLLSCGCLRCTECAGFEQELYSIFQRVMRGRCSCNNTPAFYLLFLQACQDPVLLQQLQHRYTSAAPVRRSAASECHTRACNYYSNVVFCNKLTELSQSAVCGCSQIRCMDALLMLELKTCRLNIAHLLVLCYRRPVVPSRGNLQQRAR